MVGGVGTGGTITGVGEVLKQKNPDVKVIAVEPNDSPVLSGGNPGPHKIQGIGAGFVPDIFNQDIIDEIFKVKNEEAFDNQRKMQKQKGCWLEFRQVQLHSQRLKLQKGLRIRENNRSYSS